MNFYLDTDRDQKTKQSWAIHLGYDSWSDIPLFIRAGLVRKAYGYSDELFQKTFHKYKFGHWKYRGFDFAVWDKVNNQWVVMEND